eukprot:9480666-Pyramimonas_sp.AAC.1
MCAELRCSHLYASPPHTLVRIQSTQYQDALRPWKLALHIYTYLHRVALSERCGSFVDRRVAPQTRSQAPSGRMLCGDRLLLE